MADGARVNVRGLTETARAFAAISDDLTDELREGLEKAAQPVKAAAERLAVSEIRNMRADSDWAEMRIGVARRSALVYMVPQRRSSRRKKRKRRNFAGLLASRAMDPALEHNEERVESNVEDLIDRLSRKEGF